MTTKTSSKKRPARTKPAATKATALAVPRAKRPIVGGGDTRFAEVISLIEAARQRAYQAVNTELVAHYWELGELGEYISQKIASAEWGDGVVEDLAADLARRYPGVRGYTRRNLFRMRQFFEAYRAHKKVSPLVTQLPWTHHLIILMMRRRLLALSNQAVGVLEVNPFMLAIPPEIPESIQPLAESISLQFASQTRAADKLAVEIDRTIVALWGCPVGRLDAQVKVSELLVAGLKLQQSGPRD